MAKKKKKLSKKEKEELKREQEEIDKLIAAQSAAAGSVPVKLKVKVPISRKRGRITPPMPKLR